jgi:hypothetical protein
MQSSNPYVKALAGPGALRFSAAGLLGRLQISMFGLGTVLLISSRSGRYGLAERWPRLARSARRWPHRWWPGWPTGSVSGWCCGR